MEKTLKRIIFAAIFALSALMPCMCAAAETSKTVMSQLDTVKNAEKDKKTFYNGDVICTGMTAHTTASKDDALSVKSKKGTFNSGTDSERVFKAEGNNTVQIPKGNKSISAESAVVGSIPEKGVDTGIKISVSSPCELRVYGLISTDTALFAAVSANDGRIAAAAAAQKTANNMYTVPVLTLPAAGEYIFFVPASQTTVDVFEIDITPTDGTTVQTTVVTETTTETTTIHTTTQAAPQDSAMADRIVVIAADAAGGSLGADAVLGQGVSIWLSGSSLSAFEGKSNHADFNDGERVFRGTGTSSNCIQMAKANKKLTEANSSVGTVLSALPERGIKITVPCMADITVYGSLGTSTCQKAMYVLVGASDKKIAAAKQATKTDINNTTKNYVPTLTAPRAGEYIFYVPEEKTSVNIFEIDIQYYDADGDKVWTQNDARMVLKDVSGIAPLTAPQRECADINRDGVNDLADVIGIKKRSLLGV